MENLWTPWRMKYISGDSNPGGEVRLLRFSKNSRWTIESDRPPRGECADSPSSTASPTPPVT